MTEKADRDIISEPLTFETSDGWALAGDLYCGANPQVAFLISAGTGFPRQFYRHVATYLANQGAVVLTYDNRGIGGSNPGSLKGSPIEYADWGRYDLPAALDTLIARAPNLPVAHLAHSVGGHFIGLVPNHEKIVRHAFVSIGTGYFGGHHKRYLPMEFYFWWGFGTYSLLRHGYINNVGGWKGEPLPPKLFRTWRRWSHRRAYFTPDLAGPMSPHHYDRVTAPIRSWIFTDDPIATPRSAADLLANYPNAPHEIRVRTPKDYGVKRIGHEGAFRPGREALWEEIWDWGTNG